MAKSKPLPLNNVRVLTLREIAQLWAPSAQISESTMLRELRIAVLNIPRLLKGKQLLAVDEIPPDDKLPSPDERVERAWLMEFCGKQGWPEPEFWFPRKTDLNPVGRPTYRSLVMKIFQERLPQGLTQRTISAESRAIFDHLQEHYTFSDLPDAKTIQAHIRKEFNAR
jgi:hypothetical protein